MKKRAFELTKVDKSGLDFGKHDLLLYLAGVDKPLLIDMWTEVEISVVQNEENK